MLGCIPLYMVKKSNQNIILQPNITLKFKGTKLVTSKNLGQQQCSIIHQLKKKFQHELNDET